MGEAASTYNPEEVTDDKVLRVSKSSFLQYNMCPRQYWWSKIALPDLRIPSSDAAIRGSAIHQVMEDALRDISDDTKLPLRQTTPSHISWNRAFHSHAIAQDVELDDGVDSLKEILASIIEDWGELEIVELEDKHEVPYTVEWTHEGGTGQTDCVLVGMVDGLFRMPNGNLVVVELKTGSANTGKLSRTRKELCYYRKLLMLKGYDAPTHFLTIFPDADDPKFLTQMMNKRNTDIYMGDTKGLAVLEPVGTRSINAMENTLSNSVKGIISHEWPIKWNEYFCTQWCEFHLSCNEELLGVSD
jgi:hypothetical protein